MLVVACLILFTIPPLPAVMSSLPGRPQDTTHSIQPIQPSQQIERNLSSGDKQSFSIQLSANEYLHVKVVQIGIDVVVTIFAPDETKAIEMDSPNGLNGTEAVSLIASAAGIYRLEVRSSEKGVASGAFRLIAETDATPSPNEMRRIQAETLFLAGEAFRRQLSDAAKVLSRSAALRQAQARYLESLDIWRELRDRDAEGITLLGIEKVCRGLNEQEEATDRLNELLALRRQIADQPGTGLAYFEFGVFNYELTRYADALRYFYQALETYRSINDSRMLASTRNYIGLANMRIDNPEEALKNYQEAYSLWSNLNNRARQATALNSTGGALDSLGEKLEAIDTYRKALAIFQELDDRSNTANTYNNLGKVMDDRGEWSQALEYYQQALALSDRPGERLRRAAFLTNLSYTYAALGEPQEALIGLDEALNIQHEFKDARAEAAILTAKSNVLLKTGDALEASKQLTAVLELLNANHIQDDRGKANTLTFLGMAAMALRKPEEARQYYLEALSLTEPQEGRKPDPRLRAFTLDQLGLAQLQAKELSAAHDSFAAALTISKAIGDSRGASANWLHLSQLDIAGGSFADARTEVNTALNLIESIRTSGSSQDLRTSFLAAKQDYYETAIEIMMKLHQANPNGGYDLMALQTSERKRARSLLDTLNEARADIRRGVDAALLAQEKLAQEKLDTAAARRTAFMARKHDPADERRLENEILNLTNELDNIENKIRASSPRYSHLTQPPILTAQEMQQVIDRNSVLLEYSLGDQRSYLWAITSGSVKTFELPGRAQIETAAEQVIESMTARNQRGSVKDYAAKVAQADSNYAGAAMALSKILIEPVAPLLGNKRLIIVADGALQRVSFAALPSPTGASPFASASERNARQRRGSAQAALSLVDTHEIVYEPSGSVFALQRRELVNRSSPPYELAVLADPVFDKDDERVSAAMAHMNKRGPVAADSKQAERKASDATSRSASSLTRALDDIGLNKFSALPYSRDEATAIIKAAGPARSMVAMNFEASRVTALSPDLSKYRIIHFSTHAVADFAHPELSGIVLSLVNAQGQPQNGYLWLHDVYNLNLPADLVVLSACQTAVGKEIRGEGLIALTRGFMYAGAQRVVASLWKVDDAATAELMAEFYEQMFTKKLAPAAALRAAQIRLSHRPNRREPYYWAGFVLQGEWK